MGEYQVHPYFEFLKAVLDTNENQAFEDNRIGYSRSQCLHFHSAAVMHRNVLGSRLQEGEDVSVAFSISFIDPLS